MELKKIENGYEGTFFCAKLDSEIRIEAEEVHEAYIRRCADLIGNMSDAMLDELCEAAKQYCLWFIEQEKEAMGDEFTEEEAYHKITPDTPARELLPMFTFRTMYIREPQDDIRMFFTLGGGCDWEIEHGIEAAFRDGKLAYLGSYDGVTASGLDYYIDDEGAEWNFAL